MARLNSGNLECLNLGGEEPNPGRPSYMPWWGGIGRGSQDLPCQICDRGIQDTRRVAYQMLAYQSPMDEPVAYQSPVFGLVAYKQTKHETVAHQCASL